MNKSSLKEYYIKIQELYNNAVNMLTAINQSFNSQSSEITVNFIDTNNVSQTVRIPSFLYLENRVEQLDNNLSNLLNIPKSGEAWFSNSMNMHKMHLVSSMTAPHIPTFNTDNVHVHVKDNNILKDMVNPKTYLKIDLTNVPDNIEKIYMKKLIINDQNLYDSIVGENLRSYEEYKAYLANLSKGKEYDEYDSELSMPIKRDEYKSSFKIIDVPSAEENPYINENKNNVYKIVIDTAIYSDEDDSANTFMLHKGQYLTLDDDYAIYKILSVNSTNVDNVMNHEIIMEEIIGHVHLQTFEENSAMILHLYNINYDKYHYIEVPTEENQFIVIFLGTIYNNIRSSLSTPILLNMAEINVIDADGNPILYNGKEISYIDYYNKYCKNIGDLILGISEISYPQLSNFSVSTLKDLQDGDDLQILSSATINNDNLKVERINTHLINDEYSSQLVNLHAKKVELNTQLTSLQDNINNTYNELVNNSPIFTLSEKENIKSKLNSLYTERINLQNQVISIVDNINVLKSNVYGTDDAKYRIRGNASTSTLENYVLDSYNCNIIGLQYEYKYKSIVSDTTNVSNINSTIFTEWNRVTNNDKERKLVFDTVSNTYNVVNVEYDASQNVVKWNQIDIPIKQGEDVVLRVRYKYSIGQPFIDLYTPWSDELVIKYPTEFNNALEITSIIEQNDADLKTSEFNKILNNNGFSEHISNKIIDNSQTFYHMPENIYSGFNTNENKYLSLKDKLQLLSNDIDKYREMFEFDSLSSYDVYLEWEGNSIKLQKHTTNNINIDETININLYNSTYVSKVLNLTIKNTGNTPLKLYSILPGTVDTPLYSVAENAYSYEKIEPYASTPILTGAVDTGEITKCAYFQKLGQWIYFRNSNPYTQKSYYNYDYSYPSKQADILESLKTNFDGNVQIPYNTANLKTSKHKYLYNLLLEICKKTELNNIIDPIKYNTSSEDDSSEDDSSEDDSIVNKPNLEGTILKYENLSYKNPTDDALTYVNQLNFKDFKSVASYDVTGMFLIPNIFDQNLLLCDNEEYYYQVNVGDIITIPILLEYYIDNDIIENQNIFAKKYLGFDLKTSLLKDIQHFEFSVSINYTNSISSDAENTPNGTDEGNQ